jgi:dihydrofolate reductase
LTRWTRSCSAGSRGPDELAELKQRPGKDIAILGSTDLTVSLLRMRLVDEVRIMVTPVVLGAGTSVLRTARETIG